MILRLETILMISGYSVYTVVCGGFEQIVCNKGVYN